MRSCFVLLTLLISFCSSCDNQPSPNNQVKNSATNTSTDSILNSDSDSISKAKLTKSNNSKKSRIELVDYCSEISESKLWEFKTDENGNDVLLRRELSDINLSVQDVIVELNEKYQFNVEVIETKNSTINIRINNSTKFTQQSGTTGAEQFKWVLIYSITELENIQSVNLFFIEGDHGGLPGNYSREMINQEIVVIDCNGTNNLIGKDLIGEWRLAEVAGESYVECPDYIEFQENKIYQVFNECYGVNNENPLVEGGYWNLSEDESILNLQNRKFTINWSFNGSFNPLTTYHFNLSSDSLKLFSSANQDSLIMVFKRFNL